MVSNCECLNAADYSAVYNQRNEWLNRMNSYGSSTTTPSYGYDPGLSFNGSVFDFDNSTFANTYSGLGMGALGSYGFGMPYCGGIYGNADSWWDYMDRYSDRSMAYNRHRIEKQREDEMYINGPSDSINGRMALLKRAVNKNDQANMVEVFNKYCESVKEMYPNYEGKALVSRALAMYAQANGVSFLDDLMAHSRGMFGQKFLNSLTLGIAAKGSAEENIEQLTGSPMSPQDELYGKLGKGAGAATATAIAGTTGFALVKNSKRIGKLVGRGPWGWIIAGVSAAVGIIVGMSSGSKKTEKA